MSSNGYVDNLQLQQQLHQQHQWQSRPPPLPSVDTPSSRPGTPPPNLLGRLSTMGTAAWQMVRGTKPSPSPPPSDGHQDISSTRRTTSDSHKHHPLPHHRRSGSAASPLVTPLTDTRPILLSSSAHTVRKRRHSTDDHVTPHTSSDMVGGDEALTGDGGAETGDARAGTGDGGAVISYGEAATGDGEPVTADARSSGAMIGASSQPRAASSSPPPSARPTAFVLARTSRAATAGTSSGKFTATNSQASVGATATPRNTAQTPVLNALSARPAVPAAAARNASGGDTRVPVAQQRNEAAQHGFIHSLSPDSNFGARQHGVDLAANAASATAAQQVCDPAHFVDSGFGAAPRPSRFATPADVSCGAAGPQSIDADSGAKAPQAVDAGCGAAGPPSGPGWLLGMGMVFDYLGVRSVEELRELQRTPEQWLDILGATAQDRQKRCGSAEHV